MSEPDQKFAMPQGDELECLSLILTGKGIPLELATQIVEDFEDQISDAVMTYAQRRANEILDVALDGNSPQEIQRNAWTIGLVLKSPKGPRSISELAYWLGCSRTKVRKLANQASKKTGIPQCLQAKAHSTVPGETEKSAT